MPFRIYLQINNFLSFHKLYLYLLKRSMKRITPYKILEDLARMAFLLFYCTDIMSLSVYLWESERCFKLPTHLWPTFLRKLLYWSESNVLFYQLYQSIKMGSFSVIQQWPVLLTLSLSFTRRLSSGIKSMSYRIFQGIWLDTSPGSSVCSW